jgi:RHS repeat-associated protein
MKTVISTFVAAIIVANNLLGVPSVNKKEISQARIIPAYHSTNSNPDASQSMSEDLFPDIESSPAALKCDSSGLVTYYLGPVLPERAKVEVEPTDLSHLSNHGGVSGVINTDFYVGAIFNYSVSGTDTTQAGRDYYLLDEGITNVWKGSDFWGFQGNPASGKYCSVIPYGKLSSTQICNQVCPECESIDPPGNDPGAIGCYGEPQDQCLHGGRELAMGVGILSWESHPYTKISVKLFDIQMVYYGIPKSLPPRSKLSDNKPKNTAGDPRECEASRCDDSTTSSGDPIDVLTGNFNYSYTDLSLKTIAGDLSLQRSYASQATDTPLHPTTISPGWTHNQDTRLLFEGNQVWFKAHTLNQYRFDVSGDHEYTPYNGVLAELVYDNGQYILTTTSQSVYVFDSDGHLLTWTNERGYGFTYSYIDGNLDRVTEPVSGRYLQFNYLDGALHTVTDSAGRQVSYIYDSSGDLMKVTDVRGNEWGYQYNGAHRIRTVLAPPGASQVLLTINYDTQGRAYEQHDGGGNQLTHIDFNPDGSSTSTDANGIPTNYTPDCRGVVTRSEFPGTATLPPYYVDRAYDHNFNLTAVRGSEDETATSFKWRPDGAILEEMTDQAGYTTTFAYDEQNHLRYVDAPNLNTSVDEWTSFNYEGPLLTSTTQNTSLGQVITYYTYTTSADTPQPINLLKTTRDMNGNTTSFVYDALGQLITITDAELNQTHFTYDATGQAVTITDALGRVQRMDYDPSGVVTKVIENFEPTPPPKEDYQYNLSTSYGYDEQGRPTTVTDTLDHIISTTTYDDAGRANQVFDAYNNATTYTYNEDGTLDTVTIDPTFQTSYHYDDLDRVTGVYDAYHHLVTSYTYNANSSVATETDAAGLVTSYTYDELHRVVAVNDSAGHKVLTTYDTYGDVLTLSDSLDQVTKYEYSDPGRLTRVTENYLDDPPAGYDPYATNIQTNYTYYPLGLLKEVWDANDNVTTYGYDNLYRLETVTDPLGHQTVNGYDALGNQETLTRTGEDPIIFSYDLVNRLKTIDYPYGSSSDVSFTYNELSQLTDMVDGLGQTHWEYDLLGQPMVITDPYDKAVAYEYDTLGNRKRLIYPGGPIINYQYDANGMLDLVLNGTTQIVDYDYDDAGRLSTETYANGVVTGYSYDISSQLVGINHKLNGRDLALYTYDYYLDGNLRYTEETNGYPNYRFLPLIGNNASGFNALDFFKFDGLEPESLDKGYPAPGKSYNSPSSDLWDQLIGFFGDLFDTKSASAKSDLSSQEPDRAITYTYDALDRLRTAVYSTGESFEYWYDRVGNRSYQTINGNTTSYLYDYANRLTSVNGVSYTWNDDGSLASTGLTDYTYDPAGRLSEVTSPLGNFSYRYDGLGNRYTQTVDSQTTTYTLDLAAGLTTVLREGTTTYLYGMGLIGQVTGDETTVALADRLGSVRQLITDGQDQTLLQSFDPFGNIFTSLGNGESGFGYTGEQSDGSGLVYLRARYMDPKTGRFITADPFPGVLSMPSTLNGYPYAVNNPLSYTDPSGEIVPLLLAALGASVAGGVISGGLNLLSQCTGYSSLEECTKCADWSAVGAAAGAGALAGLFGFGVGLLAIPMGIGFGMTLLGGAIVGTASGQVYRIAYLSLLGRQDQIPNELGHLDDILVDGFLGALGSAVGYGVYQHLHPPKLTSQEIGRAAEQFAAEKYPIDLSKKFIRFPGRNRIYDGTLRIGSKNYVEIKTSTKGIVYGTKLNRAQALFDYNYLIRLGKSPVWIFVKSTPSGPLADLLRGYHIPFLSLWE